MAGTGCISTIEFVSISCFRGSNLQARKWNCLRARSIHSHACLMAIPFTRILSSCVMRADILSKGCTNRLALISCEACTRSLRSGYATRVGLWVGKYRPRRTTALILDFTYWTEYVSSMDCQFRFSTIGKAIGTSRLYQQPTVCHHLHVFHRSPYIVLPTALVHPLQAVSTREPEVSCKPNCVYPSGCY